MPRCVGFEPEAVGCNENCANCKNWDGKKCLVRKLLDELYEESRGFNAFDRMMRGNRGITGSM